MSAHEIVRKVGPTPLHVCVTGGEPLIHRGFSSLVNALLENTWHRTIHIETSGCIEFPKSLLDRRRGRLWITVSPKGKWCGAKMDFIPETLHQADEVKWIIPGTPLDILDTYATPSHYLQPRNDKITINPVSLRQTLEFAEQRRMPISIQLHKLVGWR
jgi:organic radical activating enzyme